MDPFTRQDFDELVGVRSPNCVSIYLSTHVSGDQGQADQIALRNLLDEAEASLIARGQPRRDAEWLVASGRALLADKKFWHDRSAGIAVFMANNQFRCWRLARTFETFSWVGNRFYVKPLFPVLGETGRYYLLAVSRKRARLFAGRPNHLAEVMVPAMPDGIKEFAESAPAEGTRQTHSGQLAFKGKEGEVFHGQGSAQDHAKRHDLVAFLRAIDHAVRPTLQGQTVPLVFVGVEELFPHYQQVNSYSHLLPTVVHTNPDRLQEAELQALVAPLLEPYRHKRQFEDLARFNAALGTFRVSGNLEEILKAANDGRIESIFVAGDVQAWGRWNATTGAASLSDARQPADEDLLDLAALLAYRRGGRVHVMQARGVPGGLVAAALFRYAEHQQPNPSA